MSDSVTLDISTYNTLKSSEVKANLVIDELFRQAKVNKSEGTLFWESEHIDRIIELAYPRRYANKIEEVCNVGDT